MPKFSIETSDEPAPKPAMDQIPAATKGAAASIPTSYVVPIANPVNLNVVPVPGEFTYEYGLEVLFSLNLILYPRKVESETAVQDISI